MDSGGAGFLDRLRGFGVGLGGAGRTTGVGGGCRYLDKVGKLEVKVWR